MENWFAYVLLEMRMPMDTTSRKMHRKQFSMPRYTGLLSTMENHRILMLFCCGITIPNGTTELLSI